MFSFISLAQPACPDPGYSVDGQNDLDWKDEALFVDFEILIDDEAILQPEHFCNCLLHV